MIINDQINIINKKLNLYVKKLKKIGYIDCIDKQVYYGKNEIFDKKKNSYCVGIFFYDFRIDNSSHTFTGDSTVSFIDALKKFRKLIKEWENERTN